MRRHRPTEPGDTPSRRRRELLAGALSVGSVLIGGCLGDDGSEEEPDEEVEPEEIEDERRLDGVVLRSFFPAQLFEPNTDNRVSEIHYHEESSHWHFMPFEIPLDGFRPVDARFFDRNNDTIPIGPEERLSLEITRTEATPADLLEFEITQGTLVNFHGLTEGDGELLFHLVEDDEQLYTSPPLRVVVTPDAGTE